MRNRAARATAAFSLSNPNFCCTSTWTFLVYISHLIPPVCGNKYTKTTSANAFNVSSPQTTIATGWMFSLRACADTEWRKEEVV